MLRLAFVALVVVHGLIHLMGFAKSFGLAELAQLTQPIARPLGVLWLLAAVAMVATAAAVMAAPRWWWAIGAVAVVLSQVVIVTAWRDARFGTVANAIILAGVIYGGLARGPHSLHAAYDRAVAQLPRAAPGPVLTEADLAPLPAPVQRYVRQAGAVEVVPGTGAAPGLVTQVGEDLVQIGGETPDRPAVKIVLGPGTGLGVSGVLFDRGHWLALTGEGGHCSLAPGDRREAEILEVLHGDDSNSRDVLLIGTRMARLMVPVRKVCAGSKRPSAQREPAAGRREQQAQRGEAGAGQEGAGRADALPQPAGRGAGQQQRQARDEVEYAVGSAAQVLRCCIGHHGRQQPLRHAQVRAPQRDAQRQQSPALRGSQREVGRHQRRQPGGQQGAAAHPVGEPAEGVGAGGVDEVHRHHHQRHGGGRQAEAPAQHRAHAAMRCREALLGGPRAVCRRRGVRPLHAIIVTAAVDGARSVDK